MAVANWNSNKITVYRLPAGVLVSEFGQRGDAPGRFDFPMKLCFSPVTHNLIITDGYNDRVQVCV